jgi:hypothetical protein
LPNEVLSIICSTSPSQSTLLSLALLNKSAYSVVIPYLYRSITLTRLSLPAFLYGIDLPREKNRFLWKPPGWKDGEVEQVEEKSRRKRWCLTYVREVRFEGGAPDWGWWQRLVEYSKLPVVSESLGTLDHVHANRPTLDSNGEHSNTSTKPSHSTPPALLPKAHRLLLSSEVIHSLSMWATHDNTPHPFPLALSGLLRPTTLEITSGIASSLVGMEYLDTNRGPSLRSGREVLHKLCEVLRVEKLVLHGATAEQIPVIPGLSYELHFTRPVLNRPIDHATRVGQVHGIRSIHPPMALGRYFILGSGLRLHEEQPDREMAFQDKLQADLTLDGDLGRAIPAAAVRATEWGTSVDAVARGLDGSCGCYGHKRTERVVLDDGVRVAAGVRRGIWKADEKEIRWMR